MWRLKNEPSSFRRLSTLIRDGFIQEEMEPEHLSECDVVFTLLYRGALGKIMELEDILLEEGQDTGKKVEKVQACLSKF